MISITDFLIEIATPVFVIGLIWSLVIFAITIKGVYYPGQEQTLKTVFFLYVMASVLINRIAGYYGESEKAAVYGVLLASVMGLFALVFSSRFGSLVGGADAGEGLWMNIAIVVIVGVASYLLCRKSSYDVEPLSNDETSIRSRAELRRKQDWYQRMLEEEEQAEAEPKEETEPDTPPLPQRLPRTHPGIWVICFSAFSLVLFAVGQRLLPDDSWEPYSRAYRCLTANLACTLALLLLTTLSRLRLHCRERKAVIPSGVGLFWVTTGIISVVVVMSLASLPPRPVPKYLARLLASDETTTVEWDTFEEGEQSKSLKTWGGLSRLEEMKIMKRERDIRKFSDDIKEEFGAEDEEPPHSEPDQGHEDTSEDEAKRHGRSAGSTEEQTDQPPAGSRGDKGTSSKGEDDSEKSKGSRQQGKSASTAASRSRTAPRMPPPPSLPFSGLETIGKWILILLLVSASLWAMAKAFVALGKANPFARLAAGFRMLANRLRGLARLRKGFFRRQRAIRDALEDEGLSMANPFRNTSLLKQMSKAELVRYTYQAFENYAHVHGYTPAEGQTAKEFMRALPEPFHAREFSILLKLFMLAQYSSHKVPDKSVKNLQRVWAKFES